MNLQKISYPIMTLQLQKLVITEMAKIETDTTIVTLQVNLLTEELIFIIPIYGKKHQSSNYGMKML